MKAAAYQRRRIAEFLRLPLEQRLTLLQQSIEDCQTLQQGERHRRYLSELFDNEQKSDDSPPTDTR
jgi:hypothetical protein